ncbi:hypothetical protein BD324DRAFT_648814 [Kockovaella imperatae]|uniref:Uncharacterized protein n=1 Tax=Kockovaella imperatae TaxID=4999 RepID=A0A1Y1UQ78_9TREE|nr:hypothetical protein BD324DRAFT_648814 [Kockovaella imperatae]ORX40218.1 hypothetical protein BD324DRAFT_648814 [Kockovaella imperatae]
MAEGELKAGSSRSGNHIEMALADVPESARCTCVHEPVPGKPGMYQVHVDGEDAGTSEGGQGREERSEKEVGDGNTARTEIQYDV